MVSLPLLRLVQSQGNHSSVHDMAAGDFAAVVIVEKMELNQHVRAVENIFCSQPGLFKIIGI